MLLKNTKRLEQTMKTSMMTH